MASSSPDPNAGQRVATDVSTSAQRDWTAPTGYARVIRSLLGADTTNAPPREPWTTKDFDHMVAGVSGGVVSTVLLYPLELVKTRMHVMPREGAYYNFRSTFVNVLGTEGVRGMFAGCGSAVLASAGSWGGYFFFYESHKRELLRTQSELTNPQIMGSAMLAGMQCVVFMNPLWLVRTRLSLQATIGDTVPKYTGTFNAIATILREEGLRGLYRGLLPALFLTSHGGFQFLAYENMKRIATQYYPKKDEQPAWVSMVMGSCSKFFATTVTYPYQVLKSRRQQRVVAITNGIDADASYIKTLRYLVKHNGLTGLYRGFFANVLKVTPTSAITFTVYEETMKVLRSRHVS